MSSEQESDVVEHLQFKDDEKLVVTVLATQEETKLDGESVRKVAEKRENVENEMKDDEDSRCKHGGYLANNFQTENKVVYSSSTQSYEPEQSPGTESVKDIDNSNKCLLPESTVNELEAPEDIDSITYTSGDFESGISASDSEEYSTMGAMVCSNSQNEDKLDKSPEGSKRKKQKTSHDYKKYKQTTLHFYEHKDGVERDKKPHKQSGRSNYESFDKFTLKKKDRKSDSSLLKKRFNDSDTQDYRNGYPGKIDNPTLNDNLRFYRGEIISTPRGALIDDIHEKWWGNYELLESHHGYIQWLFPIRESGMNSKAQPLQLHEAEAIRGDQKTKKRLLKSYKMMLDFYGMRLKNEVTGELERSENWKKCFHNLNRSSHNYLRITRILKCLGELGYEHLKKGFLQFVLEEALVHRTLVRTLTSCQEYWIGTIKDSQDRRELYDYIDQREY